MTVNTYYFDASVSGPTDPDTAWTNDANAFDGSDTTTATVQNFGSTSSDYLEGTGTTAPSSGDTITQVRLRVYTDGSVIGSYVTLDAPTGGWSWTALDNLIVRFYRTGTPPFDVYVSATAIYSAEELGEASVPTNESPAELTLGEIEVTHEAATGTGQYINIGDGLSWFTTEYFGCWFTISFIFIFSIIEIIKHLGKGVI